VVHRGITESSTILLTTTDNRTPKTFQLAENPEIEIAWWIENTGVQFCFQGRAYVLPTDADTSQEGRRKLEEVLRELDGKGREADPQWWISQRERLWKESMSGHLRASFARPTPGTPLSDHESKPSDWPETLPAEGKDVSALSLGLTQLNWVVIRAAQD
jgi:hypothetical protein